MDPLHLGDSREGLGTAVKLNRGGCPSLSFNPSGPSPSLLVSLPSVRPASFASVSGMLVTGDSSPSYWLQNTCSNRNAPAATIPQPSGKLPVWAEMGGVGPEKRGLLSLP